MPSCPQGGAPANLRESSQLRSLYGPSCRLSALFMFCCPLMYETATRRLEIWAIANSSN